MADNKGSPGGLGEDTAVSYSSEEDNSAAEKLPLTGDMIQNTEYNKPEAGSDGDKAYAFAVVNAGEDDEMVLWGYEKNTLKTVITWIFIVLTIGALRLIFYWKPNWFIQCTHDRTDLPSATHILLKDIHQEEYVETVKHPSSKSEASEEELAANGKISDGAAGQTPLSNLKSSAEITDARVYQKYFISKKVKYVYSQRDHRYEKLGFIDERTPCSFFYDAAPLSTTEAASRTGLFGENRLEVHVTPIFLLVIKQVINPFYMFQIFSCALWYADEYEYYASAILIISIGSIALTTYSTRKMERALKSTVHQFGSATVHRDGEVKVVLPTELVPGDIIEIPRTGTIMDVDAVLLSGNCIVNESMLTGESIPVTKTPLPNPRDIMMNYDPKHHSKHTLFCGTNVIQTRYYGEKAVTAMVIRTGFMTAKGGLLRSIMFPKKVDFKFYRDTYYFVLALAAVSLIGMIYTLVVMIEAGDEAGLIVRRVLDLITIAVPPALPAALSVGIVVSQNRLKKRASIYCIVPSYINIAGSINVVCFDKTGTLTEEGLDLYCVIPTDDTNTSFAAIEPDCKKLADSSSMKAAMASCHSLTYIEGEISGDPLDVKMYEATGWNLEEVGEETNRYDIIMPTVVKPKGQTADAPEIGILRQFTFSSSLQRMSVIVKNLSKSSFDLYAKGSPEMISSLCKEETIPSDFSSVLANYTQSGYRVIAVATRELTQSYSKLQKVDRSEVETELTFLGLLVMENRLKPETTPVIHQLMKANIGTVMVTGDNMLTAVSVARQSGFIGQGQKVILVTTVEVNGQTQIQYHSDGVQGDKSADLKTTEGVAIDMTIDGGSDDYCFAMTGRAWKEIRDNHPEEMRRIIVKGAVFARMSPEQKAQLVEELQHIGYYVAMCGDGANDCGALKVAHSGISLSEAEASVASPFTSKIANIECVPQLIREGRAALVTSFGVFKFIAGYSLVQFTSVLLLYSIGANLTDFQFLYIDLIVITSLSVTFPFTPPADEVHPHSPPVKLASFFPILILVLNCIVMAAVQVGSYMLVKAQSWFVAFVPNDEEEYQSLENTAVFNVSCFQYIILALMFAQSAPFRKNLLSNIPFLVNNLVLVAVAIWLIIYPTDPVAEFMELELPPLEFRPWFLLFGVGNFIVSMLLEKLVTGNETVRLKHEAMMKSCCRLAYSGSKYEQIQEEITQVPDWPPVEQNNHPFSDILQREMSSS